MPDDLSPTDRAVVIGLLSRVVREEDRKAAIETARKELDAQWHDAERRRTSAVTGLAAYGFNPIDKDLWAEVRTAIGDTGWFAGLEAGGRKIYRPEEEEQGDDAEPSFDEASEATEPGDMFGDGRPTVREIVISQLAAAGDKGMKAADIRRFIEQAYGHAVHEKTVGMTLYRLSKKGLTRRDKQTWFSAQPSAEKENPGGDTPGSDDGQL